MREHLGRPVYVSSGYRSADLNVAIGGSKRSQHVEGRALDLDGDVYGRVSNGDIFRYILNNVTFDQLIWEFGDEDNPDWVTFLMFMMALIVVAASRLVAMMKERLTTK